ncbi:MAG: diguanylate cyclase [Gammaproteobacteria bacterium]|nr:diguanylate cyclase [Gammaproteobacteria bacterium]
MHLPDHLFRQAVDNALDIIMITEVELADPGNNKIVYVNDAFCELFLYTREEIIGRSPRILQGDGTSDESREKIRHALKTGHSVHTEIVNYDKKGQKHWIDLKMVPLFDVDYCVTHFLFIERDASERKQREKQLYHEATIDSLTGINNRHHTYQIATHALEKASRYQTALSFMMLDIDHFKQINDTYGHPVGDKVLRQLAQILKNDIRAVDTVGRVGGEEFCIVLPEIKLKNATDMANRIRVNVENFNWQELGLSNPLTISIGLTKFEEDTLDSLIKKADTALYQAKEQGRNRVAVG